MSALLSFIITDIITNYLHKVLVEERHWAHTNTLFILVILDLQCFENTLLYILTFWSSAFNTANVI